MIIPSVGIVAFKDQQVLLVRHGKAAGHVEGTYGLPAGRFEEGESAIQAAKREFEEETGLGIYEEDLHEISGNVFEATMKRSDGTEKTFSWKVFFASKFEGSISGNDETTPEWVDVYELSKLELLPNVEKAIKNCLEYKKEMELRDIDNR